MRISIRSFVPTTCFSLYLLELRRFTASICPKSMSWPKRKMNRSLHTYFFFWYPSNVLSPTESAETYSSSLSHTLSIQWYRVQTDSLHAILFVAKSSYGKEQHWLSTHAPIPLNFERMLANSLLMRFTSASLLLPTIKIDYNMRYTYIVTTCTVYRCIQFLMSEMKTASPRMPSPRTFGIVILRWSI